MKYLTKMKKLIELDYRILNDFEAFNKVNTNWNIGSYLNTFFDINAALAFSKLYFPDFVDIQNCVILDFRYNEDLFKQWFTELNGEVSQVEKMCNLYELKDFFHINNNINDENKKNKVLDVFGTILKRSWEVNLKLLYPERSFKVDLFEEYESKFITLYSL